MFQRNLNECVFVATKCIKSYLSKLLLIAIMHNHYSKLSVEFILKM